MADKVTDWLAQLAAAGWIPDPDWESDSGPMRLPCGPVMWIDGEAHGVSRSGWLGLADGIVRLHGDSDKNDCDVTEFCRRLTEPPPVVVSRPAQGRLF